MSLTTSKTLDKNMRREGVLDGELRDLDLKKMPELTSLNLQNTDFEEFKEEIICLCKSIKFWIFVENTDTIFSQIDMSKDGSLSLDEVHRWFVRTKLQGCDINTIRK